MYEHVFYQFCSQAMESSLGLTENPSNKPDVELQDDSDSASVRSGTSSELDESAPGLLYIKVYILS